MNIISECLDMVLLGVAILIVFVSFKGVKINRDDKHKIKNWTSQNLWMGNIASARLVSWKQLQATHNIDYFYSFTFESDLDGSPNSIVQQEWLKFLKLGS